MSSKIVKFICGIVLTIVINLAFSDAMVLPDDLHKCRQNCYQKFFEDWHKCMEVEGCRNCWTDCDKNLGPFPLSISKAQLQGSLVLTDIAWDHSVTDASKQCLVTGKFPEVVCLAIWSQNHPLWNCLYGLRLFTKWKLLARIRRKLATMTQAWIGKTIYLVNYRHCSSLTQAISTRLGRIFKSTEKTGGMRKSIKLIVDTSQLNEVSNSMEPVLGLDAVLKNFQGYFSTEVATSDAHESAESRMKILKDSSKDFESTYNPAAGTAHSTTTTTTNVMTKVVTTQMQMLQPMLKISPIQISMRRMIQVKRMTMHLVSRQKPLTWVLFYETEYKAKYPCGNTMSS
uniref:Uncharacterized protein n=1 Tax=Megaselia scalaris TaxID=36166 RepID=T1GP29_MEGSC